jgi:hypothetical protein
MNFLFVMGFSGIQAFDPASAFPENRGIAPNFVTVAFSTREPVPTSPENALAC